MSIAEMALKVNRTGTIELEGMRFRVRTLDARKVFGREDLKVTPLDGTGEVWVQADRVTIEPAYVPPHS